MSGSTRAWATSAPHSTSRFASRTRRKQRKPRVRRFESGPLGAARALGGETVRFTYDDTGLMTSLPDAGGGVHQFVYDAAHPMSRTLRSLAVMPDGSVLIGDSQNAVVWRVSPGG